jgi:hypothetical protein
VFLDSPSVVQPSFTNRNRLIAQAVSSITVSLRFDGSLNVFPSAPFCDATSRRLPLLRRFSQTRHAPLRVDYLTRALRPFEQHSHLRAWPRSPVRSFLALWGWAHAGGLTMGDLEPLLVLSVRFSFLRFSCPFYFRFGSFSFFFLLVLVRCC